MGIHAAVHCRGHDHRNGGRETSRGYRIGRQAVGHRPEPVRGRGRHHDRLDVVSGFDMADLAVVLEGEHVRIDRVPAERLERQGADELDRRARHQDAHVRAFSLQQAQQLDRLVGRDRTGYAKAEPPV